MKEATRILVKLHGMYYLEMTLFLNNNNNNFAY